MSCTSLCPSCQSHREAMIGVSACRISFSASRKQTCDVSSWRKTDPSWSVMCADYCGPDLLREGGTAILAPFFRSRVAPGVEEACAAQGISRPSLQQGELCPFIRQCDSHRPRTLRMVRPHGQHLKILSIRETSSHPCVWGIHC